MIDWFNLAANTLWICGCAIGLAAVSHAYWQASTRSQSLSSLLKKSAYQLATSLAGLLFALGLAATTNLLWQKIGWFILAGVLLFQIAYIYKQSRGG